MTKSLLKQISFLLSLFLITTLTFGQEVCNDGIDNDGDGLIDLYDGDCQGIAESSNFFFNQGIPTCSSKPPVFYTWTLREKYNTNEANGGTLSAVPPYPIDQRCGLFVGDLDGDGVSEIVGKDGDINKGGTYIGTSTLRVFNGEDGKILQSFGKADDADMVNDVMSQVALANVDGDNTGDIFLINSAKKLIRLQYNGPSSAITKVWISNSLADSTVASDFQSPQIADFNMDGVPEVYVGNMIFDAKNGYVLVKQNSANSGKNPSQADTWPIAYNVFDEGDLDPDGTGTFDNKADGLELIAGNKVYLVDYYTDPNNWTLIEAASVSVTVPTTSAHAGSRGKSLTDGFTSIGDLTGDGKIDIVVTTGSGALNSDRAYIYAWNPYEELGRQQIGEAFLAVDPDGDHDNDGTNDIDDAQCKANRTGRSNVADFDGDGELEIGTAGFNTYFLLETDLTLKWKKSDLDDGSMMTGSTVFDFEGDGSSEVVYSDEDTLFVWKGTDGRSLATIGSPSGTRTDYPLVVDVDNDGQAEIVITSQYVEAPNKSPNHGWVSVYRSADAPWVSARETWNQHGYFVTNVNDDLEIPLEQQDFVSPYFHNDFNTAFNQFLVQTTYLTYEAQPTFATGDLTTENVEFDLAQCPIDSIINFTLTFENNGSWKIPRNTPVSYYDGDPYKPGAVYLDSMMLPDNISPGEIYTISDQVKDNNGDREMELYVLVNHSHFTVDSIALNLPLIEGTINSPTLECDYDNNLGFIVSIENCVAVSKPEIDLDRNNSGGKTGNDYQIGFAVGEATTFNVSDKDVFIRDTDSPNDLKRAKIVLTNLKDIEETFGITIEGQNYADEYGINVEVKSDTVNLKGLGNSLVEYERVIKNITYSNSNAGPDMTERIITFEVQDASSSNDPLAQTHVIYSYRPVLDLDKDNSSGAAGSDYQSIYTEGDGNIPFVDSDLEFTDADGTDLAEAIITLTNKIDGTVEDIEVPFSLPAGILRDFTELTPGKVRLYGTSSLANYMTAISSLSYINTNEDLTAGDRTIEIIINDGYLNSEVATATITVIPVNDNPVISGSNDAAIYSSGDLTVLPFPNISDVDNDTIKSAIITVTTGFVAAGEDSLKFTANYGISGSFNNTTGELTLSGNATIEEYKAVLATVVFKSSLATSTVNRAVSVKVTDNDNGESNLFHRTIILIDTGGNDAPYAGDDNYAVFVSGSLNETAPGVINNDIDPDIDPITVSAPGVFVGTLNGSLTLNADGSFTYDPDETNGTVSALTYGSSTTETFTYKVTDATLTSNTANIVFTIKGENANPVVVDDSYTVDQDDKLIISSPGILNNDTDTDGIVGLEVVQVSNSYSSVIYGNYGSFVWYGDGSFVYTPNQSNPAVQALQIGDADLVETFIYMIEDPNLGSDVGTVTINIQGTNDPPQVYAEKTSELTDINTGLTFNGSNGNKIYVTDNDGDDQRISITVTNGTLTLASTTGLSGLSGNGSATVNFDGSLTNANSALDGAIFNPTGAYTGPASIYIETHDLISGSPVDTDNKTVNINVIDPNTDPVATINAPPTILEDETITFTAATLNIVDTDGDNQTVTITISNGVLTLSGINGLTGLTGNGASNITFSGNLTDVNNALDGAVFTPTSNYSGPASIQLFTNDGKGGSDLSTDNITITDVDELPVANDDLKTINEDNSVTIYAIANDEDRDGNGISIISNTGVSNGTLVNNGDGTFDYTPDADFNGADSFTYTLQDLDGDSDIGTVNITINPVNDEPSFTKGVNQTIDENTVGVQTVNNWVAVKSAGPANEITQILSFNVSNNNNSLFNTQPSIDASGNLTYELAPDQYGSAIVTLSISDNGGIANGGDDTSNDQSFTITVNPVPKVTLSVDNANILENAGIATFTATLNHISNQNIIVNLGIGGTAAGTDFTESGNSITIIAGDLDGTITVTAIQDVIDENNETVIVSILSVTNGVEDGIQDETTSIMDDDATPTVTFTSASQSSASESGTMTITAQLSAVSGKDVTVPFTVNGSSTATGGGTDYSISGSPITISEGSTTGTITITIAPDAKDEDNETVIVDMGVPTNATQGATTTHTATITDDDATPTVTFTSASQSSASESGTMTITAQLSAVSGKDVTVPFTVNGSSTATGSGTDYSISGSPITISEGSTTGTITITIAPDVKDEDNETVIVDMGVPTNATQGATTTHTATITDDDAAPTVTFTSASQSSASESGTMTITAQLSAVSGKDITVPFTVNGSSTATGGGMDYSISGSPITISEGSTTGTITITIAPDVKDEDNETVIVDMGVPTNATQGATTTHTATITDDDAAPTVTFTTASQSSASEAGTMTITAQLSAVSGKDITVPFTVNGSSTATGGGTDYSISGSPITISKGSTTGTITITIAPDVKDEDNETVIVDMGVPTNATQGATTTHTATITDDDAAPTVTFTTASQSSADESGTMTITAQLSAVSGKDVMVPFTVNGSSTATGSGTDYSISGSPITISEGSTTGTITITIVPDVKDEDNETVIVDMGVPTNATQGATTTHTATITDDDATPTVTFTAASQSSADESGTMTITAQLSVVSGKDVMVPFTVNGSSTATGSGTDYSISGSPITISEGSTTGTITITIAPDAKDEDNETVIVDMGVPTNATQGATTTHTATITDDDAAPTVTFTTASQSSADESGTMTITAQLSAVSGKDITVPFTVNGSSTATGGGTDYSISGSPITISEGSTTGTITITIATDAKDEDNETVIVDMGVPTNATQGATTTHTATITDDDATPTVTFTSASQSSADESGTMTITAQLSAVSGKDITVPFTVNGSSTATGGGTDYSISGSPITISEGSTTGIITITIAPDAKDEDNETVIVDMGVPTNATQGATTTHTATITDDDAAPTVTFTTASQSSATESGTMSITAQLSAVSGKDVMVPFTVNGSSTATGGGTDYSISGSPITISEGSTTGTITITIATDVQDEGNETVIVDMGVPTNATQGATTTHIATITDDDATDIVLSKIVDNNTPDEGDNVTYTITVSNNGPIQATNLVVTDNLPAGLTFVSATPSTGTWTAPNWSIGTLNNGSTVTLTLVAKVDAGTSGTTITNTISNTQDQADDNITPDDNSEDIGVDNSSDIVLTKIVSDNTPDEGDNITYTITVSNNGPIQATNLVVTDNLPAGLTFVSATPSTGTWTAPNWTVGTLNNSSNATLTLVAKVDAGTSGDLITNTVSNSQDQTDDNTTPDDNTEDITVNNSSDIVLSKTVSDNTPDEGDNITYTITVSNNGPAQATNLVVADNLPTGLTFVSATPSTGTWTAPNWTVGTLNDGANATLTIVASVDAGTSGDLITNTVSNSQDQTDDNTTPDDNDEDITVNNSSDIVLSKTVSDNTPDEGDNITYTITVSNNGPAQATNLVVADNLPAGLTFVSATPSTGTWTAPNWTVGTLNDGANATLTLVASVDAGTSGDLITNAVSNSQDQTDDNTTPDDNDEDITVNNNSDIVLTKTVSNNSPDEGDNISYTITVSNNGPAQATNLVVTDNLPAGLTFVSASPETGSWIAPNWNVGTLNNGSNATLTLVASVDAGTSGTTITNTISNSQDQTDNNTTLDDNSEDIGVDNSSDIVLTKTVDNNIPDEGDNITYTITVSNNGPIQATNLVVTDNLPAGLTFVSATPSIGTWTSSDWNVGTLNNGSNATLTLVASVDAGTSGDLITNTVSNSQDQTDDNTTPDDNDEDITVNNSSDIVLTKTVSDNTPDEGDNITYTIEVSNNGPAQATNLVVTDNLPAGLTFVSATPSTGTWTAPNWNVGTLNDGSNATLTLVASVDAGTSGDVITNTIGNSQDQIDDNSSPDDNDEDITVNNISDIVLSKIVNNNTPIEGDNITYTIEVSNNGPAQATNLVVTDNLPAGLTFVSATPSTGTWTLPNWTVGTLNTGANATLTIVASVDAGTSGTSITNNVSNTQDQTDDNTTSDDDDETINVLEPGISTTLTGGNNETSEDGTTDSFDIVLNTQPLTDVVIDITGLDVTEGSLDKTQLTFTNSDWNNAQTVTVTGQDDDLIDDDITYTLTLTVDDASSDDSYDGKSAIVTVTNTDNDIAEISTTLSGASNETSEDGTSDSFDIVLNTQPLTDVVIDITGVDATEGSLDITQVTFTNANWNTTQTITVTGVNDDLSDGDITYTLTLTVDDVSSDDSYDGKSTTVTVINTDNDVAGITATLSGDSNETSEDGTSDSFDIVLNAQPLTDVIIDITGLDETEGILDIAEVTFTSINWNVPQTITVTGADDNDVDGDISYVLDLEVNDSQSDDSYDGLSVSVDVTNIDNDEATEIKIPEGFSPGDGQYNEEFKIDGLETFDQVSVKLYNRWGNLVYSEDNYQNDWTGKNNVDTSLGEDLPTGTYYYLLEIKDNGKVYSGYVYMKRMN